MTYKRMQHMKTESVNFLDWIPGRA
jgi:hypothetical protein